MIREVLTVNELIISKKPFTDPLSGYIDFHYLPNLEKAKKERDNHYKQKRPKFICDIIEES